MTTRARRLDALFAEYVIGHEVQGACSATVDYYETAEHGSAAVNESRFTSMVPLRTYTRSLDAAWEGAEMLDQPLSLMWSSVQGCDVEISTTDDQEFGVNAQASHPAEALVLACLRAVGVDEKELA